VFLGGEKTQDDEGKDGEGESRPLPEREEGPGVVRSGKVRDGGKKIGKDPREKKRKRKRTGNSPCRMGKKRGGGKRADRCHHKLKENQIPEKRRKEGSSE